ncbi:MAG: hypothetical protein LDLANPLL_00954 [Turneriella sp.]|nr:hypothetical protein [Turneriella sp.]
MLFERAITDYIKKIERKYQCIALYGPRQSGKTTLAKALFPTYDYVSLENPDLRLRVTHDPVGFLKSYTKNLILDEIQRAPELLSYLQERLDFGNQRFILTGSNNLLLSDKIAQSLAGRVRILHILPLLRSELPHKKQPAYLDMALFQGSYPRIFHEDLSATEWLADYYQTYVEKDVRAVLNVENLAQFDRFIRLMAGRTGQLMNFASLASDTGISQPTAVAWSSVLQASFITFLLQPHFANFSKRVIKAPKVYFFDTGLLCYLLRISSQDQLASHPLRGQIFENWIISEVIKKFYAKGEEAPVYFWRDQHGHEVDLVIDRGSKLELIEIKSSATFHSDFCKQMIWLNSLQDSQGGSIYYGGDENFEFNGFQIKSWKNT